MGILSVIGSAFSFLGSSLLYWLSIFILPFTRLSTIWIIVPIWLSWFFAEFFQEKKGTSFGNAISNGAIPVWVGIDWVRQLTNQLVIDKISFSLLHFVKYFTSVCVIVFGLVIIIAGIKGKHYIKFLGRIRVVTYILAFFTPIIYGIIQPTLRFFLSSIIFFPLFYFFIELVDKYTPNPRAMQLDTVKDTPVFDNQQNTFTPQQNNKFHK